jgi:hypothetical protein
MTEKNVKKMSVEEELDTLKEIIQTKKDAHKKAVKKYQQTEKGRLANRRAQAKRYKSSGKPVGRPRKKV